MPHGQEGLKFLKCQRQCAAWRRHLWSDESWHASHPEKIPLLEHFPISRVRYDLMHCKHLGLDAYYAGSTLEYLIKHKLGDTVSSNLLTVTRAIKDLYKLRRTSSQFNCITVQMIHSKDQPFPHLKGKAAEIKHLMPILAEYCTSVLGPAKHEQLILKGLQQSEAIDAILTEAGAVARCHASKH
eukprot:6480621-Amphidinium_carterae.1